MEILKLLKITTLGVFLIVSGCLPIAEWEEYVHTPSAGLLNSVDEETFELDADFVRGDLIVIPRFRTLTSSFPVPYSNFFFYSKSGTTLTVEYAEIRSSLGTHTHEVTFNRELTLNRRDDNSGIYTGGFKAFSNENTELEKYWPEGDIDVTLHFSQDGGNTQTINFNFVLSTFRDIAWPT